MIYALLSFGLAMSFMALAIESTNMFLVVVDCMMATYFAGSGIKGWRRYYL